MASIGLSAPDKDESGGLTKKLVSCACCADLLNVAMTVPTLMPDRMQRDPATSRSRIPPWNGTPKANRITPIATSIIRDSRKNNGAILAMMISVVLRSEEHTSELQSPM